MSICPHVRLRFCAPGCVSVFPHLLGAYTLMPDWTLLFCVCILTTPTHALPLSTSGRPAHTISHLCPRTARTVLFGPVGAPCIYKCVFFLSVVSLCSLSFPSVTCTPCDACVVTGRCPIPPVSTPLSRLWAASTLRLLHTSVCAPTGKFLILLLFLRSLLSPSTPASLSPSLVPHPHPHRAASMPPAPTYRVDSRTLGQFPHPRLHAASTPPHAGSAPLLLHAASMPLGSARCISLCASCL
jgi:hypothetical protein